MNQTTNNTKSYRKTLNLPKTSFAMKAQLVQREPATLKKWQSENLYERIREARSGSPKYVFHDGPPYANGKIHLGHLLNKVLKDLVVRTKTMAGFDCPYIPGWDCHGLPIEHKVMQNLGDKAKNMTPPQIRKRCQDDARKYVKLQGGQMQRLLTLADYAQPYLTMAPQYESAVLEVFADLVGQGLVYRDLKPVHWSIANQTALAEAELEYEDTEDTSVYVLFELMDHHSLPDALSAPDDEPVYLMIWTTTPWTLPANLAIAVHESLDYDLYQVNHQNRSLNVIVASGLADRALGSDRVDGQPVQLGSCKGTELRGLVYRHPFIDRTGRTVLAPYVTLEEGTGLVHTAPGHGLEDYQTAIKEGLEVYCPVQDDGTFDQSVPPWLVGVDVWSANKLVINKLNQSGHLFFDHPFTHSYPHDWRSKTPVIFRATEQWFMRVDTTTANRDQSLRQAAMNATESQIRFIPQWGQNRMRGMLESRPDWCLSRQRSWGLPIPAFFSVDSKTSLLTAASVRAVAVKVREHGSDYWFSATPDDLLADYDPKIDPDLSEEHRAIFSNPATELCKSSDIFDVWFESGSSWNAVLRQRQHPFPADLYLEGSDQHRGWFQLSLLPALGVTGESPFRTVLTHGFMVDKDSRKMSKSLGNALDVDELLKNFGADVCRWWVASINTDNDIKVDVDFFKVAGDEYRKLRNTIRFMLGNLADYDHAQHRHTFVDSDATSVDAWALGSLAELILNVRQHFDSLVFSKAREAIFQFCNETMSAIYLMAVKDRLYCDRVNSNRRRRTQTAMHTITDALIRLCAAIVPHTSEEAWQALHGTDSDSVHLHLLPDLPECRVNDAWQHVFANRDNWLKIIENARQQLGIDNPLDCALVLAADEKLALLDLIDLADLCGISRVELRDEFSQATIRDLRSEPRCDRSWKRDGTVKLRSNDSWLSDRDAAAVGIE